MNNEQLYGIILREIVGRPDGQAQFLPPYLTLRHGHGLGKGNTYTRFGAAASHEFQHWFDYCGTGVGTFLLATDLLLDHLLLLNLRRDSLGSEFDEVVRMLDAKDGMFPPFE